MGTVAMCRPIGILLLIAGLLSRPLGAGEATGDAGVIPIPSTSPPQNDVPSHMRWEPKWRKPFDCGPISLYLLMRLTGHDATIDDVIKNVRLEGERGSSLGELSRAANDLGYSNELRFVDPEDLPSVPFPFIVHFHGSLETGTGHFFVLCGYSVDKDQYAFIDPDRNLFGFIPSDSVIGQFSGYVLLPRPGVNRRARALLAFSLMGTGILAAFAIYVVRRSKMSAQRE